MGSQQKLSFLFLLLLFSLRVAEARPLPFRKQEGYVKVLESLGVMCRCCDGAGGECRAIWDSTCAKLDCRPWKFF